MVILKFILKKQGWKVLIGFVWIGTDEGRVLENTVLNLLSSRKGSEFLDQLSSFYLKKASVV
jgi:hypothetical protein